MVKCVYYSDLHPVEICASQVRHIIDPAEPGHFQVLTQVVHPIHQTVPHGLLAPCKRKAPPHGVVHVLRRRVKAPRRGLWVQIGRDHRLCLGVKFLQGKITVLIAQRMERGAVRRPENRPRGSASTAASPTAASSSSHITFSQPYIRQICVARRTSRALPQSRTQWASRSRVPCWAPACGAPRPFHGTKAVSLPCSSPRPPWTQPLRRPVRCRHSRRRRWPPPPRTAWG